MDGTDGGVGDDFPDDFDLPEGDLPDGSLPDDGVLHDGGAPHDAGSLPEDSLADTIDLDGEHHDLAWTPEPHDAPDLATDSGGSYDPPDAEDPYDAPDAPDPDVDGDVPVVGDDTLGTDPDVPAGDSGGEGWLDLPDLTDVDVPEPAGGPPWVDTGLLGDSDTPEVPVTGDSVPASPEGGADDLRAALGEPPTVGDPTDDAYQDLVTSDDPAVRNLARLWGPPA